jgi:hypothetical protein
MLKTVSSVANALGALNYKGTWDAATNTPTLASGVGTQGDYYVVSVAGTTDLDGITNWGVGDWAAFNGSVWQRVEGGADGNFVNLDVTGTTTLDGNLDISGDIDFGTTGAKIHTVSDDLVAGTGDTALRFHDGDNAIYPVNVSSGVKVNGAVTLGDNTARLNDIYMAGDLIVSSGSGIDFSATAGTGTSELLDDYEEGVWTPAPAGGTLTINDATYTKVGRLVTAQADVTATATTSGDWSGLPFNLGGSLSADKQAGFVGYQTEESSAVWGILADNTLATFTFRNGSSGKQLTTGSRAVFTIIYYTN